jgi:ubiquinone biosynthesis protein COQ9
MTVSMDDLKSQLLEAALIHVAFDGWSEVTFKAAVADAGVDPAVARAVCPRGAVDLALAYHAAGDAQMHEIAASADLSGLRYSEKIAAYVRFRLEVAEDKEAVRRGTTLFALPPYAADGAKAIWGTADEIWTALGDTSEDVNWYTKRVTLSGVYSATVLFWLGDDSPDHVDTWAFLDRRIEDVMRIEKIKAQVNGAGLLKPFLAGPKWMLGQIKAPSTEAPRDLPGRWARPKRSF